MTRLQRVYMDHDERLHRISRSRGGRRGRWLLVALLFLIAVSGKGPWAAFMEKAAGVYDKDPIEVVTTSAPAHPPAGKLHYARKDLEKACEDLELDKIWADFEALAGQDLQQQWEKVEQLQALAGLVVKCGSRADHLRMLNFAERRLGEAPEDHYDYAFTSTLDSLFSAMLAIRLEEDLAGFGGGGRPFFPALPEDTKRPPVLGNASPALLEAWALAQRVRTPLDTWQADIREEHKKEFPEDPWGGPYAYSRNSKPFYLHLIKMLKEPAPGQAKELARYHWGSWCGTGSGNFTSLRNQGLLYGLAQEGQHDKAVGALLSSRNAWPMTLRKDEQVVSEWGAHVGYLRSLDLDPEELLIGGLFSSSYSYAPSREVTLKMLGAVGSENAVDLVLDLGDLPPATFQDWETWGDALKTFVQRSGCRGPSHYRKPDGSVVTVTAGPALKIFRDNPLSLSRKQVNRLNAHVDRAMAGDYGPRGGSKAVQILALDCLGGTESRLQMGLKAPSNEIREAAARALQSLGFEVKAPEALPDLTLRLELTGYGPLEKAGVYLVMNGPHTASTSWSRETNDGLVTIERDKLFDPSEPVQSLYLQNGSYANWDEPFYVVKIPKPWPFHHTETVRLDGGSVTVSPVLPKGWSMPEDGFAVVRLELQLEGPDKEDLSLAGQTPSLHMQSHDFRETLTHPWVQSGRYRLTISYPGLAPYVSDVFEIGSEGLTLSPELKVQ